MTTRSKLCVSIAGDRRGVYPSRPRSKPAGLRAGVVLSQRDAAEPRRRARAPRGRSRAAGWPRCLSRRRALRLLPENAEVPARRAPGRGRRHPPAPDATGEDRPPALSVEYAGTRGARSPRTRRSNLEIESRTGEAPHRSLLLFETDRITPAFRETIEGRVKFPRGPAIRFRRHGERAAPRAHHPRRALGTPIRSPRVGSPQASSGCPRRRPLREGILTAFSRVLGAARRVARRAAEDSGRGRSRVPQVAPPRPGRRRAARPRAGKPAARGLRRKLRAAFEVTSAFRDADVLLRRCAACPRRPKTTWRGTRSRWRSSSSSAASRRDASEALARGLASAARRCPRSSTSCLDPAFLRPATSSAG